MSAPLTNHHIFGCQSAAQSQKLLWRSSVSPYGTPRAAADLTTRAEALFERTGRREGGKVCGEARAHFCFWRTKTKNISLESEQKRGDLNSSSRLHGSWRVARETPRSGFPPSRLPLTIGLIFQLPARQAWVLARLSRGPERIVLEYVSTGPERKRSQNPGSAGVVTS